MTASNSQNSQTVLEKQEKPFQLSQFYHDHHCDSLTEVCYLKHSNIGIPVPIVNFMRFRIEVTVMKDRRVRLSGRP